MSPLHRGFLLSMLPYAGRHRPAHHTLRRPALLTNGFLLPASAAAVLLVTGTGASIAEAHGGSATLSGIGQAALGVSTPAAETVSDESTIQERRSQANARSVDLLARQQQAERTARAKERVALATKKAAAAKQKAAAHRWVTPLDGGRFTSGFKMRWGRMHEGDDFSTPVGTPVKAMSTGTVIYTGWYGGGGNTTKIRYWDGTVSFFMHQSRISTKVGQQVSPGQVVGLSGNTGHSTGPHLHVEIHPKGGDAVNPMPWLHQHGLYTKVAG